MFHGPQKSCCDLLKFVSSSYLFPHLTRCNVSQMKRQSAMLGKLLDFLFGKDPDIFDETGRVRHKLGDEKWKMWEARFKEPEFNWREHRGFEGSKPTEAPSAASRPSSTRQAISPAATPPLGQNPPPISPPLKS